jgi:hypothetical protein
MTAWQQPSGSNSEMHFQVTRATRRSRRDHHLDRRPALAGPHYPAAGGDDDRKRSTRA